MTFAKLDPNRDTPTSTEFGDIYFSPTDGVGESQYHFLLGNDLDHRFANPLNTFKADTFTIAETGFGTGLNFLLAADLWRTHKQDTHQSTLHFISVEKYPIRQESLAEIYQKQRWSNSLTEQIIANYPNSSEKKQYDFQFDGDYRNIRLTLLIGDVLEQLPRYPFVADAWFLDGFAPSKNPDMWQPALFELMAKKSTINTTFATFTAASAVRKGLENAGFDVRKTKGFGKKRERLIGVKNTN